MGKQTNEETAVDEVWRLYLTAGYEAKEARQRRLFGLLPGEHRCRFCQAPFEGVGGILVKVLYDKRPSKLNPRLCNVCDTFAAEHQGGAEIELSLLFADVRGSTTLAEGMSPVAYSKLINRFYKAASAVLIHSDALIDKLVGDQVAGIYVPGFAGPQHARRAVEAAEEILRATGHGTSRGPWLPVGAGVHTGMAFVGAVGSKDATTEITVLGDAANTAARLSSSAAQGEVLVSEAAARAAQLKLEGLETRRLELKGKSQPVQVHVFKVQAQPRPGVRGP